MHTIGGPEIRLPDGEDDGEDRAVGMADSVRALEQILQYSFKDKKLLEEALTHPSYTDSKSYQRLEFIGDTALCSAFSNFIFLAYPDLEPGYLSPIRAANINTEKMARIAVKHGLYRYMRHNTAALDEKVKAFVLAVQEEEDTVVYGGAVKAPKVLADIVEAVAGAVYVDCRFDLQALWVIFRGLLEPIITFDIHQQQPQPVTMLFEVCQKAGKHVDIRYWRRVGKNIASVYVDGEFIASGSSDQKENAKLHAAKAALEKLPHSKISNKMHIDIYNGFNGTNEIEGAKQKLHELCGKKRWPKPSYRIENEEGPAHEKKFVCSVQIKTEEGLLSAEGGEKSRVKDAENSAASSMICGLHESNHIKTFLCS